jgi:heterogeneous nuclear ribonucleoprotein U-like protein 1
VVVFLSPSELKSRAAQRFSEMEKEVPAEAVNEMTGILDTCTLLFYSQVMCLFSSFICLVSPDPSLTSYHTFPLSANFVLPLSKDMPDSKEPFNKVIIYSKFDISVLHLLTTLKFYLFIVL